MLPAITGRKPPAAQISPAIAVGIPLPLLEQLGFSAKGPNSPQALQALKYVYCLGPIPFMLAGALMFMAFPIDARRHGIIRRGLERRKARMAPELVAPGTGNPVAAPIVGGIL
mgnify:CR=1 FL=1